jgi:hypothetical protein
MSKSHPNHPDISAVFAATARVHQTAGAPCSNPNKPSRAFPVRDNCSRRFDMRTVGLWTLLAFAAFVLSSVYRPAAASTPTPVVGTLDLATGGATCTVAGWSKDLNSTAPTRVDFYINAPYGKGGTYVASVVANLLRTDLPYPDQYHGFNYTFALSTAVYTGLPTSIYAYGIALSSASSNALLNLSPKTVTCTTVNAKNYGATGNGTTNDAAALQLAIDMTPSGGSTYIPAGTYMLESASSNSSNVGNYPASANCAVSGTPIQSALKIANTNIQIYGDGTTTTPTILMLGAGQKMRIITIVGTGSTALNNITIDNLVVDGNKANRTAAPWPCGDTVDAMISGWEVNGLSINSIEARNGLEDGMGCWFCNRGGPNKGVDVSSNFVVSNTYSHDNGTFALMNGSNVNIGGTGISSGATVNVQLTKNTLTYNTSTGIWIAYGSTSVIVEENTIGNNIGAAITLGGSPLEGATADSSFTIVGNTLSENGAGGFAAIEVNDVFGASINTNQVSDNSAGIRVNVGSSGIILTDNTITASTSFGVNVVCNSSVYSMTNNSISANGVAGGANTGGVLVGRVTSPAGCPTADASQITTLTGNTITNNGTGLPYQVQELDSAVSIGPSNWDTAAENTISYTVSP